MGIPLGKPSGPPSVKLRSIGDYVDLAVVDLKEVPWTDYSTGKVKVGEDGRERTQDAVSAVVVRVGMGVVAQNDTDRPVVEGEVVSVFFAGHRRWDFVQAQKALEGGMNVGDVMRIKYERDEPSKGGNPKKVWSIQIRHPKLPEEQPLLSRCEQLHREGNSIPLAPSGGGSAGGSAGGGSTVYEDEEPF